KEKNRLILSHRAVVEQEKGKLKQNRLGALEVGKVIDGTVQRITDFGAFVDIGGIDGLVHISQLSHEHVNKPSDVVHEGQQVKVKVLEVNEQDQRLSLSIKELLEKEAEEKFDYELPEESKGFQLGEMIGDKLKNLGK